MKPAMAGILLLSGAFAQDPASRPEFLVADIRQNISGDADVDAGALPGGQFAIRNASLKLLLGYAYKGTDQLLESYIVGAPAWVDKQRFDLTGKAPANTPDKTLFLMLQVFLEKEFKLKVHEEQRPMHGFALVRKRALKLQNAKKPDAGAVCHIVGQQGSNYGGRYLECTSMSIADFAQSLPGTAPEYIDRPVVDLTGLKGVYDFKLDFVGPNNFDKGGLTLFDSMLKLGLKLEERRVPVAVIVVDHIEKLADDN